MGAGTTAGGLLATATKTVTSTVNGVTNSVQKVVTEATQAVNIKGTVTNVMGDSIKELTEIPYSTERLAKVVPRYGAKVFNSPTPTAASGELSADYSDRGPISSIRLLANPNVSHQASVSGIDLTRDFELLLANSDSQSNQFTNFFLTSVDVSYNEKVQIMTTFGDGNVVYYFGKQPVMFNIQGILFDTIDQDWFTRFHALYEVALRGSRLAQNFELLELFLPNLRLVGTLANFHHSQDSSNDSVVHFSVQFIAKLVEPIPMPSITGVRSYEALSGSFIDFSVGKKGVEDASHTLSLIDPLSKVSSSVSGISGGLLPNFKALSDLSHKLNDFKSSIFSPIYGIISSITKTVKQVTGDISKIISSFTNPVNHILRDIQNISSQVIGVANLIENSVNSIIKIPERLIGNVEKTIQSLDNAFGAISRVPETISQSLKRLSKLGRVKGRSSLSGGSSKRRASKVPLLNSGAPYKPQNGYKLV